MKRRQLLMAAPGLAGAVFAPQLRAAVPCPPGQISIAGGNSASSSCPVSAPAPAPAPAPGNSALQSLAASMAPGTWAKLTPANDQNAFLGVGSVSGSMIQYCNDMPWNPVTRAVEIIGQDHGYPALR